VTKFDPSLGGTAADGELDEQLSIAIFLLFVRVALRFEFRRLSLENTLALFCVNFTTIINYVLFNFKHVALYGPEPRGTIGIFLEDQRNSRIYFKFIGPAFRMRQS
jgi:hypothetical protein